MNSSRKEGTYSCNAQVFKKCRKNSNYKNNDLGELLLGVINILEKDNKRLMIIKF